MSSLILALSESNISVANNTSDVSVAVTVKFTDGWWAAADAGSSMTVTCNGTSKTLKFGAYNIGANGSKNLGSVKFTGIKHNSDGSKSVSASASWTVPYSGGYKVSGSASKTLTKIPRASSISSISGSTLGSAVTVNITRLSSDFTHKVTYKLGSITRTYSGQTTSCTFTPPLTDASQIPNAVSGTASVTVQTYSGSTAVGSAVSKSFSLNLPGTMIPVVNALTFSRLDNNVPSAWGIYVKGFSGVRVSFSGAGVYGSSIATYTISGAGSSANTNVLTCDTLNTPGINTFTGTVRDSRGRTASTTASITVLDYSNPTASLSVERCNSDGTANTEGTYVKAVAAFSYTSLQGKNSITEKSITVGSYTNTSFSSGNAVVIGGALSIDQSYVATITIKDSLGRTASAQATVPTGAVTMDFKSGGKGVAFGKVSEKDNLVDSAWPVYAQGQRLATIAETCINRGTIPANANLDNYTATGFYHQPGNANASSGSNYPIREAGLLVVYNVGYIYQTYYHYYGNGVWTRNFYNNAWTGWVKVAKTTDSMTPASHNHSYATWLGAQYASGGDWMGWYSAYGGSRRGYIQHSGTDFNFVNEAGGYIRAVGGHLSTSKMRLEGTSAARAIYAVWGDGAVHDLISLSSDNLNCYLGPADFSRETVANVRGKYVKLYNHSGGYCRVNGAAITSDRNLKTDFRSFNELHEAFFMNLEPQVFKYENGTAKRDHFGFIAQDVEQALSDAGLSTNDFAGIIIDKNITRTEDDTDMNSLVDKGISEMHLLRMEEFIALNTHMLQKAFVKINELESKIASLASMTENEEDKLNKTA